MIGQIRAARASRKPVEREQLAMQQTVPVPSSDRACIVHSVRNSLDYANWKDRKPLAAASKPICTATSAEAAQAEFEASERGPWSQKFLTAAAAWCRAWHRVIPFFAFLPSVRHVIYKTNAIESINAQLRKIIKTRGHLLAVGHLHHMAG